MFVDEAVIKPWSAAVELTVGCNLRCPCCFIHSLPWIHDRNYFRHMSPEDAHYVACELASLKPNIRVRFSQRGEPLLNPNIVECVARFREGGPHMQLQIISNGTVLLKGDGTLIEELFGAGLNILVLDCYEPYGNKLVDRVEAWDFTGVTYHHYGDGFSPWYNHGPDGCHIVLMPSLWADDAGFQTTRRVKNQGGNAPSGCGMVVTEPLTKICPHPWREIAVHYDGVVPICCNDVGSECAIGNIFEEPLVDIWKGDIVQAARRLLRYGQRWFAPCCRCDGPVAGRNTAIPHCDKATERDYVIVQEACAASPGENGRNIEWWGP